VARRHPRLSAVARKSEWQSLIDDLEAAAATRGAHLTAASPSIDSLAAALHPELGRDQKARRACLHPSASARIELGTTAAAIAAFDDFVDALRLPQTSHTQVAARMQALAATFRCADRALVNIASQLAGVFDNSALNVTLARHDLEGTDLPTEVPLRSWRWPGPPQVGCPCYGGKLSTPPDPRPTTPRPDQRPAR